MLHNTLSPFEEWLSYETLWGMPKQTLKSITDLFRQFAALPSLVLGKLASQQMYLADLREQVADYLGSPRGFSVCVNGTFDYPKRLRDALHPVEVFQYRGELALTESRCVSIVGTRSATEEGRLRAARLARELVREKFTVVSGLAKGIDTAAMEATVEAGGRLIGVIGTPIDQVYPKENTDLQELVATKHLLLSQVPFFRYAKEPFKSRRYHFPARNETMSALTEATVIVEASEGSGTLTQARECLRQGRKLFILNNCFENPKLTWPALYETRGAVRVRRTEEILEHLAGCDER